MIIVFSGTDGAGKSTQIERLVGCYSKQRRNSCYLWARGGYTPGFSLIKRLLRLLAGNKLPTAGVSNNREVMLKKGSVARLWLRLAILDLILFYGLYARFLHYRGKVVICDRYIEDTYLDFTRNFGNDFQPQGLLWRALVLLAPRPSKAFLLTVPVDVSLYRSTLKHEPFPDTPETLEWRLQQYMDEAIFPSSQFYKIDCQNSVNDIQQEIQKQLVKGI